MKRLIIRTIMISFRNVSASTNEMEPVKTTSHSDQGKAPSPRKNPATDTTETPIPA